VAIGALAFKVEDPLVSHISLTIKWLSLGQPSTLQRSRDGENEPHLSAWGFTCNLSSANHVFVSFRSQNSTKR
jgi:hypothetical protein